MKRGGLASLPVPLDTQPMEARTSDALPSGGGWQFEPKWDGFRCLAFRAGREVELKDELKAAPDYKVDKTDRQ